MILDQSVHFNDTGIFANNKEGVTLKVTPSEIFLPGFIGV